MGVYRATLRYKDVATGIGWTITSWQNATSYDNVFSAADDWNTLYMGCCNTRVRVVDLRVSHRDILGDMKVYLGSGFGLTAGTGADGIMPLAECAIIKGQSVDPAGQGRSMWKLHGFDLSMFNADGTVDVTNAAVAALSTGSGPFLQNYRKNMTPKWHWSVVDPPEAFEGYLVEGPYVRRLGNPFLLPGQRHRYTRTPAP